MGIASAYAKEARERAIHSPHPPATTVVISTVNAHQTAGRLERIRAQQIAAVEDRLRAQLNQAIATVRACDGKGLKTEECLQRVPALATSSSYIWVHLLDREHPERPIMVMHPTIPSLDGTEVSDFRDKERFQKIQYRGRVFDRNDPQVAHIPETNLFVRMNEVCAEKGEGVVSYYWPKPCSRRRGLCGTPWRTSSSERGPGAAGPPRQPGRAHPASRQRRRARPGDSR